MNITPVKFSQVGLYQNKTCNSSVSKNNSNFSSYSLQKNADTVSFSGLLRKSPIEKALSELGLSKKIQKGLSAFLENSLNFLKKFQKAIDTEDIPENLAKPVKQMVEDEVKMIEQLTTSRDVDSSLQRRLINNVINVTQDIKRELSNPQYDDASHMKDTIFDALDLAKTVSTTPSQTEHGILDILKRITQLLRELIKDDDVKKKLS